MGQSSAKSPENNSGGGATSSAPTDSSPSSNDPPQPPLPPPPEKAVDRLKRRVSKIRIPKTVTAFEKTIIWHWEPVWLRVCVFILFFIVGFLLVFGLSCSEWLIGSAFGYNQGLFIYCISENATEIPMSLLPAMHNNSEGCHWMEMSFEEYTTWAFISGWFSLFVCLLGAIVFIVMYISKRLPSKYYLSLSAALLLLLAVFAGAASLVLVLLAMLEFNSIESEIKGADYELSLGLAYWLTLVAVIIILLLSLFALWTCSCISREVRSKECNVEAQKKQTVKNLATPTSVIKQDEKSKYVGTTAKIGKNVTIGERCVICPGVTIGDNVIIGAGSVVAADVPSNSIVGGDPATIVPYSDNQKIFVQS